MGKKRKDKEDDLIIKANSDLFIATMFSAPKNEPLLCSVINSVWTNSGQVPIKKAKVLNPFNIKEFAFDKRIVLDVRVTDEWDRIFCIEIQTVPHAAFVERIMFGWADTFTAQAHAGDEYETLKPVFCIVITEFKIFADIDAVHLVFELRERNRPTVVLSNHLQIHFLQLFALLNGRREALEGVLPNLQHWLNFLTFDDSMEERKMAQLVENDPLIMSAVSQLRHFAADPNMRELERRRKLWKLEYHSGLAAAKTEGKAEEKVDIARNMKSEGFGIDIISKMTGLSSAEIERLD